MASVSINGANWVASIKVWHASSDGDGHGKWRRTWRSTGVPSTAPKRQAQRVADALQRAALAASPKNPRQKDRATFIKVVEDIWKAAGLVPPPMSATWRQYAERFLADSSLSTTKRTLYRSRIALFTQRLGKRADELLCDLRLLDLQEHWAFLLVSNKSPERHMKTLISVLDRAVSAGVIAVNPSSELAGALD